MNLQKTIETIVEQTLYTAEFLAKSSVKRRKEIRRQINIAQIGIDAVMNGETEPTEELVSVIINDYDGDAEKWFNDNHEKQI